MNETAAVPNARAAIADAASPDVVLCVDLDGTLLRGDLTFESMLVLLRERPWSALAMPVWLLRGRAHLKSEIAARISIDARLLPYDERVVALLQRERDAGRRIVLATATVATTTRRSRRRPTAPRSAICSANGAKAFAPIRSTTPTSHSIARTTRSPTRRAFRPRARCA